MCDPTPSHRFYTSFLPTKTICLFKYKNVSPLLHVTQEEFSLGSPVMMPNNPLYHFFASLFVTKSPTLKSVTIIMFPVYCIKHSPNSYKFQDLFTHWTRLGHSPLTFVIDSNHIQVGTFSCRTWQSKNRRDFSVLCCMAHVKFAESSTKLTMAIFIKTKTND